MSCKNLIGCQLVSIDDTAIVVQKNNVQYTLKILPYEGDCCGYNDITTQLLIDETETNRNPVITRVELIANEEGNDYSVGKLTLFGEYKPIATVNTLSSSGSGCCYGACVTICCDMLGINEMLSQY